MIQPRSIRTQLTLWYAGVLAFSLLLFGMLFYLSVVFGLQREIDHSLRLQAEGVAGAIRAFREAEEAAPGSAPGNWQGSPVPLVNSWLPNRSLFSDLAQRWAQKTSGLESYRMIQILSSAGDPIIASAEFYKLGSAAGEGEKMKDFRGKGRRSSHNFFRTLETSHEPFRLITHPMTAAGGRVLGFVQIAESLRPQRSSLSLLRLWLGSLLPLLLAVATVAGWFLASRALQPVDRIIIQVEEISGEALEKRIDIPKTGDEIERLARTFDYMMERIEQAFRRLRQFSAAASHELRTPLTVMKGELEVALRRPRDAEEYQRILRTHLATIDDLSHIVEELLMLARSEAAQGTLEWKPVNLQEIACRAEETWKRIAKDKGIRLEVSACGPIWVTGERRLLERLVANLLDNAVRVTSSPGQVIVRVDRWKDKAQLIVQDTGPGIPAEELPQIFDRFFQLRSLPGQSGSAGLGLGLCRWIAEAHRGRLEVSSTVGRGTLFTVWIPLRLSSSLVEPAVGKIRIEGVPTDPRGNGHR